MADEVLSYAPKPPRHRRLLRLWCAVLVAVLVATAGWRWGPGAWATVSYRYNWHQCLTFRLPSDFVVYEEDPAAAARLRATSAEFHVQQKIYFNDSWYPTPPADWGPPACYTPTVLRRVNAAVYSGYAFVHSRTSPGGLTRLVTVGGGSSAFGPKGRTFGLHGKCLEPRTPAQPPMSVRQHSPAIDLRLRSNNRLRLFAGQPDPADASHFTIRYEIDGEAGTIDGWLRDDGHLIPGSSGLWRGEAVELKVRDGPALSEETEDDDEDAEEDAGEGESDGPSE